MARVKNKYGLTPQQEAFCQYVVDAYGNNPKGILVEAYRKAYNCKNETRVEVHYVNASKLAKEAKIALRIEELREEQARLLTISREEIISEDVSIMRLDPLDLWIEDEKTHQWRMRYLHEIPKSVRKYLKFVQRGRRLVPDVDKDAAKKRLIEVLGYASAKDINLNSKSNVIGELRIGYDDDEN
jgi:hypothetical protein